MGCSMVKKEKNQVVNVTFYQSRFGLVQTSDPAWNKDMTVEELMAIADLWHPTRSKEDEFYKFSSDYGKGPKKEFWLFGSGGVLKVLRP